MAKQMKLACDRCGKSYDPVSVEVFGDDEDAIPEGLKLWMVRVDRARRGDSGPRGHKAVNKELDLCSGCRRLFDLFVASGSSEGRKSIGVPQHFEVLLTVLARIDEVITSGDTAADSAITPVLKGMVAKFLAPR